MKYIDYRCINGKIVRIPVELTVAGKMPVTVKMHVFERVTVKRLYIKLSSEYDTDGLNCGYVDLHTGELKLQSTPAWWAHKLTKLIQLL